MTYAVVSESSRYLTQQHLHFAYRDTDFNRSRASPLQSMANDRRSAIYASLVNLSAILAGMSTRLVLIWRFRGCNSLREWYYAYPGDVRILRQSVASLAGAIHRRQRVPLREYLILTLSDPDMPEEDREHLLSWFVALIMSKRCGTGFLGRLAEHFLKEIPENVAAEDRERRIKERVLAESQMLGDASFCVRMSVAPCENEHALHRMAAVARNQPVTFARLAGGSLNRQVREQSSLARKCLEHHALADSSAPRDPEALESALVPHDLDQRQRMYIRAQTPAALHRTDWLNEQLVTNPHFRVCSADSWTMWREAWQDISEGRLELYLQQHQALRVLARENARVDRQLPIPIGDARVSDALVPVDPKPYIDDDQAVDLAILKTSGRAFISDPSTWSVIVRDLIDTSVGHDGASLPEPLDPALLGCIVGRGAKTIGPLVRWKKQLGEVNMVFGRGQRAASSTWSTKSQTMPPSVRTPATIPTLCHHSASSRAETSLLGRSSFKNKFDHVLMIV